MNSNDREVLKGLHADAYDLVINGVEIGGGPSGSTTGPCKQELQSPGLYAGGGGRRSSASCSVPSSMVRHPTGIAFGLDRLCAVMNRQNNIRDYIAFPKNNMGRDMMIDAPSRIDQGQLDELGLDVRVRE